ncbi:hypothetical protein EMIT0196P_190041 [Pseudomonas chlororaphis]
MRQNPSSWLKLYLQSDACKPTNSGRSFTLPNEQTYMLLSELFSSKQGMFNTGYWP